MNLHFPPQKLLVAVDGSKPGWAAFEAAKRLALDFDAELEALFVEDILPDPQFEPALATISRALAQKRSAVEAGLAERSGGFTHGKCYLRVVRGRPADEIAKRAAPRTAHLVVMGTHGRSGSERFLMGSTAEAVFHRAKVPVLALRENGRLEAERILAPCNLEPYADEALVYACALARALKAKVTALFVAPETASDGAGARLRGHLEELLGAEAAAALEFRTRLGHPGEQIALEAEQGGYGLVVLSGHHGARLTDLTLGSTAERLSRRCRAPLLVVPSGLPLPAALSPTRGARR